MYTEALVKFLYKNGVFQWHRAYNLNYGKTSEHLGKIIWCFNRPISPYKDDNIILWWRKAMLYVDVASPIVALHHIFIIQWLFMEKQSEIQNALLVSEARWNNKIKLLTKCDEERSSELLVWLNSKRKWSN